MNGTIENAEGRGSKFPLLALSRIAELLIAEGDSDMLVQKLLLLFMEIEQADAGAIFLYDAADGRLAAQVAEGYDLSVLESIRIASGQGVVGQVYQKDQAIVYPTLAAVMEAHGSLSLADQETWNRATAYGGPAQSAVGVPLATEDLGIGVLLLESHSETGRFSAEDLDWLTLACRLAALAVHASSAHREISAGSSGPSRSELISTLAHEMRTPLTSIKGYSTALLMDEASFSPEVQREFLRNIDRECDTLEDLIRDSLESSSIETGALKLELEPVDLTSLAEQVARDMSFRSYGHRFVVEYPKDFPIVMADPDRVVQVFRNLLDNAVKYSPDGKLVVIRGEVRDDEVVFSVSDQGAGIAPEDLNRLFEKFFRVKAGASRHIAGSGLGLPIARAIVESHGGQIWAESRLGQGSTFYFSLPLRRAMDSGKSPSDKDG